ncbi:MAG TPA: phosphatase domain-containing protein [Enteractinococcus sp.]
MARRSKTYRFPTIPRLSSAAGDDATPPEQLATLSYYSFQRRRRDRARRRGAKPRILSFTGYGSPRWVRIFSRVLLSKPEWNEAEYMAQILRDGVRGWQNFVSPPIAYAQVNIEVNGERHTVRADRNGVVDARIEAELPPGWSTVTLHVEGAESTSQDVLIIGDETTSAVICDVDDTVWVTALPRPLTAAWNSFLVDEHARRPVAGMSVMLNRLAEKDQGTPVFYVSTGPWNVAHTLNRFMTRHLFPLGPMLLTSWGPTEDRWFRSGMAHKVDALARLAADFPHLSWMLIGDDGQHDPEIYTHFAYHHPGRVDGIAIRQLSATEALLAGGRAEETQRATSGIPWAYGPDGAALSFQLENSGLLPPRENAPLTWPQSVTSEEQLTVAELRAGHPQFTQDSSDKPQE